MTHGDLVIRAERWLRNSLRCHAVLIEHVCDTLSREVPDAIGWTHWHSVLVECKTSRSDYHADQRKMARHALSVSSLGHWRFYLTVPGLLDGIDLSGGWGWYEVHPKTIRHAGGVKYGSDCPPFDSCQRSERIMLSTALSKYQNRS